MIITNQKILIAKILKDIKVDDLEIEKYHKKPKTFTKFPAITYHLAADRIKPFLKNEFDEKGSFQIDIWSDKVSDISKIVIEVKKAFLSKGFFYVSGNDFDDPSGLARFLMIFERR